MIYTVTFNPSLDYIVTVKEFRLGITNRASSELILPGGKGINVSAVLRNLGTESTALGFTAGFVGEEIEHRVQQMGIQSDFIRLEEGNSRINFKLQSVEGTEINGSGPRICMRHCDLLMEKLDVLGEGDFLVLAGSIPDTMPDAIYRTIMERLEGRGIAVVVDAAKDLLLHVLEYHPFLIKPNHQELGEIFHTKLQTREEAVPYAEKLQEMGASNVLVSLAGEGAVLAAMDGSRYTAPVPEGTLINSVGAGDSMVAGFLAGWLEKGDYAHAFQMGVAAGSASAYSQNLATEAEIRQMYRLLHGVFQYT